MEAVLVSAGVVALAELGDKTQVLIILLAARYRAPVPIMLGMFVATALNHGLAATLGNFLGDWLAGDNLRWLLAASFVAIAFWMLLPESVHKPPRVFDGIGAFGVTVVTFFFMEMGDTTQLATMVLAARYHSIFAVAFGTTMGIMIANAPAVYLGRYLTKRMPLRLARLSAAAILFGLAAAAMLGFGGGFLTV
jgi:putative Ca2+/H+ antiporter (TMEM165/GDT1 family)